MAVLERTSARHLGWRRLLVGSTGTSIVVLALTVVALRDLEAALFAVLLAGGLGLLRVRKGTFGTVILGLLLANTALWMMPAAWSNISHGEAFATALLPAVLAVSSSAGLAAAVATFLKRRRGHKSGSGPRATAKAAAALFVVAVVASLISSGTVRSVRAGDISLETHKTEFSDTALNAESGSVTVHMRNRDLFWHTFTVRDLDVDLRVPVSARRSVTFDAAAGVYEFVCAIPGHAQAGMKGTLTIR